MSTQEIAGFVFIMVLYVVFQIWDYKTNLKEKKK